jgi:hypothetical protein
VHRRLPSYAPPTSIWSVIVVETDVLPEVVGHGSLRSRHVRAGSSLGVPVARLLSLLVVAGVAGAAVVVAVRLTVLAERDVAIEPLPDAIRQRHVQRRVVEWRVLVEQQAHRQGLVESCCQRAVGES